MEIYTIGFTKKSASQFFGALRAAHIQRLVDIRLNNSSQLAGFTKRDDLRYFLHELCAADYVHEPSLAPTEELLSAYKQREITWADYEQRFLLLMETRNVARKLEPALFAPRTVLLCSEPKPDRCHRRLVAEYLCQQWGDTQITHL